MGDDGASLSHRLIIKHAKYDEGETMNHQSNHHNRLEGKIALITAAGQGIGRATAEAFASAGAKVFATDINETALTQLNQIAGITAMMLDVTDKKMVQSVSAKIGKLDILFNCAGYVHHGTILQCDEDDFNFSFNLNVKAMYYTISTFLPAMIENGGGSIINMASVASSLKGVPNRFVYCASKAAVIGMSKAIAADYVTENIRCNIVCPGTIDSPSMHERLRATGDYETALKNFIARQPMGRIGTAEEVASLVLYLASDESAFVTGQHYAIDGGWSI